MDMSTFNKITKHPETGAMEEAVWMDDYYGRHHYGVKFPDSKVFYEEEIEKGEKTT